MIQNEEILLEVKNLKTYYKISTGIIKAIDNVSFQLNRGETLGLIGESGCGKTTLIKTILRILPSNGLIAGGIINYKGNNILKMDSKRINKLRWEEISLIPQSAMNSLDPVYKLGDQIVETILAHESISKKEAYKRSEKVFEIVGLGKNRLKDYPHQYSGGMKQRAVIAMSLVLNPEIIIADEPTTALDVVVQAQILSKINNILENYKGSLIMATHDISVIAQTCIKIAVIYGGKIVEFGKAQRILKKPYHPYMMAMKNAFPSVIGKKKKLISISGNPPSLLNPSEGCRFAPRCPFSFKKCLSVSPNIYKTSDGYVTCHRFDEVDKLQYYAEKEETWIQGKVRI